MAIHISGPILEFLRKESNLISELNNGTDEIVLKKPKDLTKREWAALKYLLEPGEAPLLVRSHGQTIANPLTGLTKSSINRMIDFLLIRDEPTFRRMVQAVNLPSATVSALVHEEDEYNIRNNNNGIERAGPIGDWINFSDNDSSVDSRPNIVINNDEYNALQQSYAKSHTRRHKKSKRGKTKRRPKSYLTKRGNNNNSRLN